MKAFAEHCGCGTSLRTGTSRLNVVITRFGGPSGGPLRTVVTQRLAASDRTTLGGLGEAEAGFCVAGIARRERVLAGGLDFRLLRV